MRTTSKRILAAVLCSCAVTSIYLLAYFRTVQRRAELPVIQFSQSGELRVYRFYPDYDGAPEWFFLPAHQADRLVLRGHMWAEVTEKRPATVRHGEYQAGF